jgi:hypothetical protein
LLRRYWLTHRHPPPALPGPGPKRSRSQAVSNSHGQKQCPGRLPSRQV